jgi:hypothetical protein
MGEMMREDISSILSAMYHTHHNYDLSYLLSPAHIAEGNFIRTVLDYFTDPDEDEEIDEDISDRLNPDYIRGIMMGLVLAIDTEKRCGEQMGRASHGEVLRLFDTANAFLVESQSL